MADVTITVTDEEVGLMLSLLAKIHEERAKQHEPSDAEIVRQYSEEAHAHDPSLCHEGRVWVQHPDTGRAGMADCTVCR